MCADADLPVARDACCYGSNGVYSKCYHSFERTTFQTSDDRCEAMCYWKWVYQEDDPECNYYSEDAWYWTSEETCSLQVKGEFQQLQRRFATKLNFHFLHKIHTNDVIIIHHEYV